jgi:hypothetical protein
MGFGCIESDPLQSDSLMKMDLKTLLWNYTRQWLLKGQK